MTTSWGRGGLAGLGLALVVGLGPALADYESPSPQPPIGDAGVAKPWNVSIRAFVGNNNNVPLAPTLSFFNGETDSLYYGATFNGIYRFLDDTDWTVGVGLRADKLWHADEQKVANSTVASEQKSYDLSIFSPTLFGERRFVVGGIPTSLAARYNFRYENADIAAVGQRTHALTAALGARPLPNLDLSLAYSRGWDESFVTFPVAGINSRDADRHQLGISGKLALDGGRRVLGLGYTWWVNQAEGSNWDYEAQKVNAFLRSQIYGPVWGQVTFAHTYGDYNGFISGFLPAPGRDYEKVIEWGAKVIWTVSPMIALDAYWFQPV